MSAASGISMLLLFLQLDDRDDACSIRRQLVSWAHLEAAAEGLVEGGAARCVGRGRGLARGRPLAHAPGALRAQLPQLAFTQTLRKSMLL